MESMPLKGLCKDVHGSALCLWQGGGVLHEEFQPLCYFTPTPTHTQILDACVHGLHIAHLFNTFLQLHGGFLFGNSFTFCTPSFVVIHKYI